MRFPGSRFLSGLLLSGACAGLAGCLFSADDKVAQGGAQDFPNTVTLGMAASSHISDHAEWDQFSVIPSSLPTFQNADSLFVAPESLSQAGPKTAVPAPKKTGLAKTGSGAALDTVYWDLSDTAVLGVARFIRVQETLLKLKGDTVTFRYDAEAKDSVKGNELVLESKGAELWKATERRQAYRYSNTDSAGGFDRAVFIERIPAALPAGFKVKVLVLAPGPDGAFGSALDPAAKVDNRPVYYAFARIRANASGAADTTESFDITDVDGDGTLWGDGDSGVVDFRQKIPDPPLRPQVKQVVQKMRAVLFKAEQKTYPISYRETREEKDGKKVAFSVRGARDGADSTFEAGDTVVVNVHVDYPGDAKLAEKTSRYKVVLSGTPKRYAENRLLKYTLEATWRKDLSATKLVFTPDAPVPSRELSITGGLVLDADFGGGHTAQAEGRFENKIIWVVLTDLRADGKPRKFRVDWDAMGTVLQQKALE